MKEFVSAFVMIVFLAAVGQAAPVDAKSGQQIRQALNSPTQIEFVETPLKDVVEYLKDLHHIEIQLDSPAFKEAGIDESSAVTKSLKGISLRSALRLTLDELQLKYVIHNEVLLITTAAKAESDEYVETRVYIVTDLVRPERDGAVDAEPLKDLLRSSVASSTWDQNGGKGSMSELIVNNRLVLVVAQSQEVHEKIEAALEMLRRTGGLKSGE